MLQELSRNLTLGPLILVLMTFFMMIAYVSARFAGRYLPHLDAQSNMKTVDSSLRLLATGFLFLMVFIIVNAWNYKEETRRAISTEANYLSIILRSIRIFPPQEEVKIRQALSNYLVDVRMNEWEAMKKGEESYLARENLEALFSAIQNYKPQTYQEKIYHNLAVTNMNNLLQARRDRVSKIESIIPQSLMTIFFWFSVILTFLLGLIRGKDSLNQLSPLLIFAALLGFDLAIALDFDFPYTGTSAASKKAYYQGILGTILDT